MSWAAPRIPRRAARWESRFSRCFRSNGAFTLASTHLLALKMYGATTEGVLNASMGFDEQTLGADVCSAPGRAGQIGRAGDRQPPGTAGGTDRAGARAHVDAANATWRVSWTNCTGVWISWRKPSRICGGRQQALAAREQSLPRSGSSAKRRSSRKWMSGCSPRWPALKPQSARDHPEDSGERRAAQSSRAGRAPGVRRPKREFEQQARAAVFGETPAAQPFGPIEEGARVRLKGVREPARVRRKLAGGLARSGGGIDEDAGLDRRRRGGAAGDARRRALAEKCVVRSGAALGCVVPRDQCDRAACRGSAREGGQVPGQRQPWHRWIAFASCTATAWAFCAR